MKRLLPKAKGQQQMATVNQYHMMLKPYWAYWALGLLVLLAGLVFSHQSFDIQLHDTYYVISLWLWDALLSALLGLCGWACLHWEMAGKKPQPFVLLPHFFLSVCSLVAFHWAANRGRLFPGDYFLHKQTLFLQSLSILVFLLLQMALLVYFAIGLAIVKLKKTES